MGLNFDHVNDRLQNPNDALPEHEFEYWVNKTAALIGRSYIQTFGLVRSWPLEKIKRRYIECTKHCPEQTKPAIRWWALRKREREVSTGN